MDNLVIKKGNLGIFFNQMRVNRNVGNCSTSSGADPSMNLLDKNKNLVHPKEEQDCF